MALKDSIADAIRPAVENAGFFQKMSLQAILVITASLPA
jgi:hypothetical protein